MDASALTDLTDSMIKKFFFERRLPSGPWGLPFVGYFLFLGKKPYEKLVELLKKYGNVFR
ncbi:hypothetical protein B4U79_18213 [Dinothrombium tinctorium]|uniref:Uncharacterized protein n=1 Tax=Dinothrombium tinctorium TaxID=1965070 RepID=A0A443QWQ1_9ACAR|nr:hypothetical protein B4U79_18213 [Dinothrombium tinctorium]